MNASADPLPANIAPAPPGGPGIARRPIPWLATWILLLAFSSLLASIMVAIAHGGRGFFIPVLAICICVLAALFDGWTGRIPNPLTYTAILLGLALNGLASAAQLLHLPTVVTWLAASANAPAGAGGAILGSLAGFAVCTVLGALACLAAGVHGGDLKLLAALGSLLGLFDTGQVLIVALLIAVAYSLLNLLVLGGLNRAIRLAAGQAMELLFLGRTLTPPPDAPAPGSASHIPMALPLALGVLAAQLLLWRGGFL